MKIGLFSDDFLPRKSGVSTVMITLKTGLEELGHEVYIFAPKVRGYHDHDPHIVRLPSINPLIFDKSRLAVPMPQHTRKIINLDLDIVHSHTNFSMGVVADYVAKKSGIPHITTAHTIWSELIKHYPVQVASSFGFLSVLYQLYFLQNMKIALPTLSSEKSVGHLMKRQVWYAQNLFFNAASQVIAPSAHMAKMLNSHGLVKPSRVAPNGIDMREFDVPRTRKFLDDGVLRVVSVGRISPEKRQEVLIRALAQAPNVKLSLIGDGPSTADCKRLATQLGVQDRVTFYGTCDQKFVRKIMLDSDAFALASYKFDNHPMVLIEAAAAGLPIVYCDPQLKTNTGTSHSRRIGQKSADFAREFKNLQSSKPKVLTAMSRAAKKDSKKFDHITFAKNMLKEYKRLL
jgi:glycosyltransferase involved in cell wall biosynthesis